MTLKCFTLSLPLGMEKQEDLNCTSCISCMHFPLHVVWGHNAVGGITAGLEGDLLGGLWGGGAELIALLQMGMHSIPTVGRAGGQVLWCQTDQLLKNAELRNAALTPLPALLAAQQGSAVPRYPCGLFPPLPTPL